MWLMPAGKEISSSDFLLDCSESKKVDMTDCLFSYYNVQILICLLIWNENIKTVSVQSNELLVYPVNTCWSKDKESYIYGTLLDRILAFSFAFFIVFCQQEDYRSEVPHWLAIRVYITTETGRVSGDDKSNLSHRFASRRLHIHKDCGCGTFTRADRQRRSD